MKYIDFSIDVNSVLCAMINMKLIFKKKYYSVLIQKVFISESPEANFKEIKIERTYE